VSKVKIFRLTFHTTLLLLIIILLTGCQVSKGLSAVMNKKVKTHHYTYEDKSIIFTPLVHFGQKEFYTSLRDSIIAWKKNDYTIYYEQITSGQAHLGLDSLSYDSLRRKFRRIDGGNVGTAEDYEEELQEVFKKGVAQPKYEDLGIDSTDIHADATFFDLVDQLENLYGKIILDSCDYTTHLDSTYNCSKGLKMKKLDPVYVDYRNTIVIEKVRNSAHNKIVILFGAAHRKGMKKLLQE
jgi:acyl carrier protein